MVRCWRRENQRNKNGKIKGKQNMKTTSNVIFLMSMLVRLAYQFSATCGIRNQQQFADEGQNESALFYRSYVTFPSISLRE